MFDITLITVGKLKEKFYLSATAEYEKRIKGYCQFFKETRQYQFVDMRPKLQEISLKKRYVKDWNAVLHT